ncbi:MAG: hypothetical protein NC336_05220 [Clostridium sp.]|nr:hypothetical protein [Clostridium sp.]
MRDFKKLMFKPGEDRHPSIRAWGEAILYQAENEYADFKPQLVDGRTGSRFIYIVRRYDREGLIIVDDDYELEGKIPEKYSDILPLGMRKACALCDRFNEEILKTGLMGFEVNPKWDKPINHEYLDSIGWKWRDYVRLFFLDFYCYYIRRPILRPNAFNDY